MMMVVICLLLLLGGSVPAQVQDCADCDGGAVVVTGTVKIIKHRHLNGQLFDCVTMSLEKPLCVRCEFVGGKTVVQEIMLVEATSELKLPQSGKCSVSGTLTPGETPWYCRDVVLMVSKIDVVVPAINSRNKDEYPTYGYGNGTMGYGIPDKIIADTSNWSHAVKTVCSQYGLKIVRVEFYKNKTYPVFFVTSSVELRHMQLFQTDAAENLAQAILKANARWAFEIVDQTGDRFRYNSANAREKTGFDLFMDEESGFF